VGVAVAMAAAGFAQFSPAAALADVAEHFGQLRDGGDTVAEQAGLPGTVLGAGLAPIRLAALAALPLAAVADRVGRRRALLTWATVGPLTVVAAAASPGLWWLVSAFALARPLLTTTDTDTQLIAVTLPGAASPGYWWFVAVFALARPQLTATDSLGEVMAAELTGAEDRAKAVALMSAAYGVGAGVVAVIRGAAGGALGFRGVFALALVPLAAVWATRRLVVEPDRYQALRADGAHRPPALRSVPPELRGRLAVLAAVAFASALVTGPVNTFAFVYAENVLDAGPALTGALVVAAGPVGLAGLVVGRVLADRVGRRPTSAGG